MGQKLRVKSSENALRTLAVQCQETVLMVTSVTDKLSKGSRSREVRCGDSNARNGTPIGGVRGLCKINRVTQQTSCSSHAGSLSEIQIFESERYSHFMPEGLSFCLLDLLLITD